MKIAIVHEMLVKMGGAENVVKDIWDVYPDADVYTLIYDEKAVGKVFPRTKIKVASITQRIFSWCKNQRFCLPFMARAVESLDLSEYDMVISSSSGFAHGCITKPTTKHIVYYHSPARYLWDWTNEYRKEIGWAKGIKAGFLNMLFCRLRKWDYLAGQRHDIALSASVQVQKRVQKYYRRESALVYPPVNTHDFSLGTTPMKDREYYIITSALTEFKRIDRAVRLFNTLGIRLVIVGYGNHMEELQAMAEDNIEFVGRKNHKEINTLYQDARGFILPGREDFGIAPVEAMAAGLPVFAFGEWWALETITEETGQFFFDEESMIDDFETFHTNIDTGTFIPHRIRQHAKTFSKEVFIEKIQKHIDW